MTVPRRWSSLSEPLRGAGYVVALGILITIVGALVAGTFVWVMT